MPCNGSLSGDTPSLGIVADACSSNTGALLRIVSVLDEPKFSINEPTDGLISDKSTSIEFGASSSPSPIGLLNG